MNISLSAFAPENLVDTVLDYSTNNVLVTKEEKRACLLQCTVPVCMVSTFRQVWINWV